MFENLKKFFAKPEPQLEPYQVPVPETEYSAEFLEHVLYDLDSGWVQGKYTNEERVRLRNSIANLLERVNALEEEVNGRKGSDHIDA